MASEFAGGEVRKLRLSPGRDASLAAMQRPVGLLAGLVLALFCACGGCLGAWFHGARHGWGRDGVWDAVTATTDAEDE